jgi:hypothetical protein
MSEISPVSPAAPPNLPISPAAPKHPFPPDPTAPVPVPHWRGATKVLFRFCAVYFTLYVICTQMISGLITWPNGGVPNLGVVPPISTLVFWVIRHVFHDTRTLAMQGGSGDKMYDWVLVLCLLTIAAVITILWSLLDRKRPNYERLQRWFRVFLRFGLGSTLISYGAAKAIPLQMPYPPLTRLLEPYGNFSPMGVLWYSIGASRPYEIFTGCVELLCGILLFIPRTQLAGAALALAATAQVFTLNMTYDVPVKLFSFHLVLMSLVLLVPDMLKVCRSVLYHRARWIGTAIQVAIGAYLIGLAMYGSVQRWHGPFGGGAPKPPLYGIWVIDKMTIDGVERSPLVTDYERWRRVVIQYTTNITFWRMDDTPLTMPAKVDVAAGTITLTRANDPNWKSVLAISQPTPERLVIDGEISGKKLHMETSYFDPKRFLLNSRGFNWIQEAPFNR